MVCSPLQSLFGRLTQAGQHGRCMGLKSRRTETYKDFGWGNLKRPFSRSGCRWDENIKEKVWEGIYCVHLVRHRKSEGLAWPFWQTFRLHSAGNYWLAGQQEAFQEELYFMGFVNLRLVGGEHINFNCHILYILSSYHKYIIYFPHQTRYKIIPSSTLHHFSCIL